MENALILTSITFLIVKNGELTLSEINCIICHTTQTKCWKRKRTVIFKKVS